MPNEATNFKESLAENMNDIVFGQGHFTEKVWFFPYDESIPPREVDAIPTRKMRKRNKHAVYETTEGMVKVRFRRDPLLGVVHLVRHDAIRLETDKTDDRWVFINVEEETLNSVLAVFQKSELIDYGNVSAGDL